MSSAISKYRVWSRFSSRRNGQLKFKIIDMPTERFNDVADFIVQFFAKEEASHKATGVTKSEDALKEFREILSYIVKDPKAKPVVCVLDDGTNAVGKIIGSSVATISDDKPDDDDVGEFKTEEVRKMLSIWINFGESHSILKFESVKSALEGRGMAVHAEYRGHGIATELLRVRRLQCIDLNIPVTCAWFTGFGSQKAAEKDGWKTVAEVNFEELGRKYDIKFENVPPTCKLMAARVD